MDNCIYVFILDKKSKINKIILNIYLFLNHMTKSEKMLTQYYNQNTELPFGFNSFYNIIEKLIKVMKQSNLKDIHNLPTANIIEQIKITIQNVSKTGNFQKRIFVLFLLVSFFTAIQTFSNSLFYMNPVFECEGMSNKVSEEEACKIMQYCKIVNTQTITNELSLYCDQRKNERTWLQTSVGFGNWLGLFMVGYFSDRKGRKLCFCIGIAFLNLTWIFQLIGVYRKSVTLLLLAEIISGFSNKMIYLNFLVLLTRFTKRQSYQLGTLGWLIACHGFSQIAIATTNELFHSWKVIIFIYAVGILGCSIASWMILKQDPIFLFDRGNMKKLKEVVQSIGQQNEQSYQANQQNLKRVDDCYQIKLMRVQNGIDTSNDFNISEVMRWDIFFKALIIGLSGCTYLMVSKSIELSIQELKYSYNFNLLIVGVSNLCGFTTAIYIIKIEQQRKRGLIYTSIIYVIISMLFLFPFCTQNGAIESLVIFCLRFFLCWSCNFYTRLKVDSFPEKYQITIIGVVQFFINFGTILGPMLVQQSVDNHINPIVSLSIIRLILGTLPVFFFIEQRINLNDGPTPKEKDITASK